MQNKVDFQLPTKLSDFSPVQLDQSVEIDNSIYSELHQLLTRVSKSGQKSAQITELLQDEINKTLSQSREMVDEVLEQKRQLANQLRTAERGFLDLLDLVDGLRGITKMIEDKAIADTIRVTLKAKDQICERVGVQLIPCIGMIVDSEVHFVNETEVTDNPEQNNEISSVIQNGYRLGEKLLRKATVITYKFQEKE
jgi:molecular chaperone GrpE (heat shock protein)